MKWPILILSPLLGTPENVGVMLRFRPLEGPEEVGVRQLIFNLSLLLGTPEKARVTQQFRPLIGPREGGGVVAPSDFVPSTTDSRECRGYAKGWGNKI